MANRGNTFRNQKVTTRADIYGVKQQSAYTHKQM